jgi:hypothetical protein
VHYVTFVLGATLKFSFIKMFACLGVLVAIWVNFLPGDHHVIQVRLLIG